jgi:hypothetical protein
MSLVSVNQRSMRYSVRSAHVLRYCCQGPVHKLLSELYRSYSSLRSGQFAFYFFSRSMEIEQSGRT